MNLLLFSDLHLTQQDLPECIQVLEEIGMLANQHNVDLLIDLGDTFDTLKPSSLELDTFATFIKRLNKKLIIIAANSHESENEKQSILNHYGILNENITIIKEYQDDYLYCGHLIVKEAKKNFGATISKEQFKKFRYVFLGHQHRYETIKPNICQLGSCKFVNFDEAEDNQKVVALIEDYKGEKEKVHFIPLKSPIPMISLELDKNSDLQGSKATPEGTIASLRGSDKANSSQNKTLSDLLAKLDQLPAQTKVRIVFKDYQNWVSFLPYYQKYKDKFILLKQKNDFIMLINLGETKKDKLSLKESLVKWLENNNIPKEIKEILIKEINEN